MDKSEMLGALREHWLELQRSVERWARKRWGRELDPDALEELTQEASCLAWEWALAGIERDKRLWEHPGGLARLAVRAARWEPRFGSGRAKREALTAPQELRYCPVEGWTGWLDALAVCPGPEPWELAAARLDVPPWVRRLSKHKRRVARELAKGRGTCEVASLFGMSAGRVSQLRRELRDSWERYHGPEVFPQAGAK